jgi:hypothetical protein
MQESSEFFRSERTRPKPHLKLGGFGDVLWRLGGGSFGVQRPAGGNRKSEQKVTGRQILFPGSAKTFGRGLGLVDAVWLASYQLRQLQSQGQKLLPSAEHGLLRRRSSS